MDKWQFFNPAQLKPCGWLRRQLELQADGLAGNLDKVWVDVRESAWIGGSAEGWERVPYWLDGFIPLAYLLEREDMISRAKRYMDAIMASQRPDGWICPCAEEEIPTYDTWAVLLICKVLVGYYRCSRDERVIEVLYKTMKNYHGLLSEGKVRLFSWGKYRWFEGFIAINFLYSRFPEPWLKDLARILKSQGADYEAESINWKRPLNKWTFGTHIVNIAMMLKSEAVSPEILGEEYLDKAEAFCKMLDRYNGTPVGLFTGDECLSGLSPIQGTELCAVAEQMYSYELLYAATGDAKWAQRLEVLAFNALPATISDDMWTHQYDQMSNQIDCIRFPGRSIFRTNGPDAHLFGLEPNYGCCTANMGQAWPKFALSSFLYSGNQVLSAVPVPSEVNTQAYSVSLETEYPFRNSFRYKIEAREDMVLQIRVPSFALDLMVDGKPQENKEKLLFPVSAGAHREINLSFRTVPEFVDRPHGLKSAKMGALVFSLPIAWEKVMYEYEKDGVERKHPYCDYELVGKTPWNYGLTGTPPVPMEQPLGAVPFSSREPPILLRTTGARIPWEYEDGFDTVCAKTPESSVPYAEEEALILWPYGCAKLRMTELPLLEKQ